MTQVESDAQLGNIPETTPEMRRAAALTVAAHAADKADARRLLAMLGLDGGES
jgi:predicted deacylase